MRFFLCLAAALVASLHAQNDQNDPLHVTEFTMPEGLADGSILTFWFKHTGDGSYPESVSIKFYDLPKVDIDNVYDAALVRIDRDWTYPVLSTNYVNGKWLEEVKREQPLDEEPASNGWWRVDIYKHDNYHLNVFFQGFWSDIRTFKSLSGLRVLYVMSKNIHEPSSEIHLKTPSIVPPMSGDEFKQSLYSTSDVHLTTQPAFPEGSHMEFTVVLRASGERKYNSPALMLVPSKGGPPFALKIGQEWVGGTHKTFLASGSSETVCTNEKPNGDLQHVRMHRRDSNVVSLRVFYKQSKGAEGVECLHTVPDELVKYLDDEFKLVAHDGAVLLHFDHSIPRKVELQRD